MRRLHAAMWSLSMMACGSSPSPSDAGNAPMDGALDASTTDAGEAPQCPAGQTFCGGACVTLETDREHCGECGRRCPMGEVCSASACGLDCSAPAVPCEDGDADYCADLSSDEANCGACGRRCELGLTCLVGDCALVCPEGTVDCDGRCADLNSDSQHCGSCANSCNRDHAVGVCRDRACALTCETGYGDCDLSIDNGCETDLVNSTAHCRSCGVSCAEPHVAESRCSAAGCVIESCESGFADCNAMAIDGCEADLGSSSSCGACGRTCDARYPCSAAGECLAVPVAGAVALPVVRVHVDERGRDGDRSAHERRAAAPKGDLAERSARVHGARPRRPRLRRRAGQSAGAVPELLARWPPVRDRTDDRARRLRRPDLVERRRRELHGRRRTPIYRGHVSHGDRRDQPDARAVVRDTHRSRRVAHADRLAGAPDDR
ncbi:MAG: hypothetical protein M5U28_37385 [Sandaracinaceae bacterium]|nr:hypothetical protein [Sandaracinaceae bacterium]